MFANWFLLLARFAVDTLESHNDEATITSFVNANLNKGQTKRVNERAEDAKSTRNSLFSKGGADLSLALLFETHSECNRFPTRLWSNSPASLTCFSLVQKMRHRLWWSARCWPIKAM